MSRKTNIFAQSQRLLAESATEKALKKRAVQTAKKAARKRGKKK